MKVKSATQEQPVTLGTISNLDYVILLCERMAQTRAFYLDVMKFPLEMDRPEWVSFRVGSGLLTLRPRGQRPAWDGPGTQGSACIQLAFRVPPPAVDACHQELIARGVEILSPPQDLPSWRHRTLFFRDPERNIIEIYAEI
jgi:catechol 2,3-dioxygenase-like lactoylglutathione lyase family enzyme